MCDCEECVLVMDDCEECVLVMDERPLRVCEGELLLQIQ